MTTRRTRRWGAGHSLGALMATLALSCTSGGGIRSRFTAVHNTLETLGINQLGHLSEGSLAEGGRAQFPMDLQARCYTFVAFGAGGARDVDLEVFDANNTRVANDASHDAQAAVTFCARAAGRYNLALRMAAGSGSYLLGQWQGSPPAGMAGGAGARGGGAGTCATAIPITPGQTVTGNTAEGGQNQSGSCVGVEDADQGAPEVVYTFTLERRQLVTAALETAGNFDGALYIRSACEDAESEQGCNDDEGDINHSRLSVPLEAGTYFLFVDGFGRNRGRYTLSLQAADVPSPAEVCQNAAALTPNTPVTGQLSSQDHDIFRARCGGNARGPERVYSLVVPRESRVQLHEESDFDAVIHVRRACADASSEVACNDDAEDIQHARLNTVLQEGTYYVFADGFHPNAAGNYTIEADLAPIAGGSTPGDTCQDAVPLTPGTPVEGNTFQAHDDLQSPCGAPQEGYDVVYRLEVPNRSRVKLWFDQSDLRQQGTITVVRDCAQIANAREQCRAGALGEQSAFDQVLDAGTYFVVVDSAAPRAFGRFRLNARLEDAALVERLCRTAPLITPGRTITGTTAGEDRFQASCAGGARSAENLYRLVIRRRSSVRIAVTSTTQGYDPAVYIRQTCASAASERACNDDASDQQHSLIETTLEPGTYTVFVDGFAQNNRGSYTMETTVTPQ